MITIKLPFESSTDSLDVIQQSNVIRYSFNRFKDDLNEKEIRLKSKSLNNIELLDSWFIQCGIKESNFIFKKDSNSKVIFGGKWNWKQFIAKKITKLEFKENRIC